MTAVTISLWIALATAAEGLSWESHQPKGLGPGGLEEVANFDDGHWVKSGEGYTWQLDQGHMDSPDAASFCNDLPGDVLFVGDSMTEAHYVSFVRALGSRLGADVPCWYGWHFPKTGRVWDPREASVEGFVHESAGCDGARRIAYIRNDMLRTVPADRHMKPGNCSKRRPSRALEDPFEAGQRRINKSRAVPWDFPEIISRFKVIVLNVGVHYRPDEEYTEALKDVIGALQRYAELDNRYVFFRTTTPGVANCESMNGKPPFQSLQEAEDFYDEHPWFHGQNFKRQNEIAKKMFTSHGFSVLDVYKPTLMNGHSGHVDGTDCLHYKSHDGPFDHWNRLLYNVIRRRSVP